MKINKDTLIGDTGIKINDLLGKILWTNPNPTSSFAPQNITLNSDDYDILLWIFKRANTSNQTMSTFSPKGYGARAVNVGYGNAIDVFYRGIDYINNTTFSVIAAYYNGQINNSHCIPLYVIGYKTNLFN